MRHGALPFEGCASALTSSATIFLLAPPAKVVIIIISIIIGFIITDIGIPIPLIRLAQM